MTRNYSPSVGVAVLAAAASLFPSTGGTVSEAYYSTAAPSCVTPIPCTIDYVTDKRSRNWIKFQNLAEQWKTQRGARSSITEAAMLRPYQSIVGMGEDAIEPIISQLRLEGDDPDQWFWALLSISEANDLNPPEIQAEDQGDFAKMAQTWIKWAEDNGYAG